jgi:inhibitor of KinA
VLAAKEALRIAFPKVKLVHAYCSLMIQHRDLDKIKKVIDASEIVEVAGKVHHVEVDYAVAELAAAVELSADEVIRLHSEPEYLVYFLGFLPGFPYLGGLNPRLHLPRLAQPKQNIAAGSVAIGGQQTGIYPQQSPGGWHVIGHTDFELLPTPFAAGDRIKFIAR